uniref:catalase n=1 Tax=uncultured Acinetobacter sp. TaxID=165433 RepID=UPI002587432E
LQGRENLDPKAVEQIQGKNFSHMTEDLVGAIATGDYPKWDLYIQTLRPEQLADFDFDPLDATKIWPDVPERRVGQMVLNRNVGNFFQETEQVALAPSNLIKGIEPSEDRLLQGRLFAYADTQMYRVGANAGSLPINQPRFNNNAPQQNTGYNNQGGGYNNKNNAGANQGGGYGNNAAGNQGGYAPKAPQQPAPADLDDDLPF